jgi:hypothetical protein
MKVITPVLLSITLLMCIPASAEIEKTATPCETGLCLKWWPKLAPVAGWHQDSAASNKYAINAQVPDGYTFSNAETVIYSKANYKPRTSETKSLEMLIDDDKKEFLSHEPNLLISEVDPIKNGDGKLLRSFTFFPKDQGNWEQATYGEEGEFYLIFTISSRTKAGFVKALDAYKKFISQYKEKP